MEKFKAIARSTTRTKKRFFGIVSIAIILIAALGTGYYFRFKNNQSHFKKYGLEILDSYYYRIGRQLNNEILGKLSKYENTSTSFQESDTLCKTEIDSIAKKEKKVCETRIEIIDKAIDNLFKEIELDNGFLEKPFSEFVITTIVNTDTGSKIPEKKSDKNVEKTSQIIKTENSLFLGNDFDYRALLGKDSLNNGLVKTYEASGADYLMFGRKYRFKYAADDGYACEIVLIGLVNGKTFNKVTRELDPYVIAMLLTFLLISLFGLPFFKMLFISSDERVFSRDVIAAGFALVVGASLVVVIFMSLMEYSYKYNVTLPNDLELMGKTISKKFVAENKANVEALYHFPLDTYESGEFDALKPKDSLALEHFKFIITIDDQGAVRKKINLIKKPELGKFPVNIKDREYVKDFMAKKNLWGMEMAQQDLLATKAKEKGVAYVMRPVVAMESGEEEAVYMIEDKDSNHQDHATKAHKPGACCYRVASAQLSSIHLPVMPFGFQFALIDNSKNGEVWFHSQRGKSTLEEFFKVSRNANDLRAAIYTRVDAGGRLNYHGSKYLYFITPVPETNLSAVVLYDLTLLRLQTSEVLSITGVAISCSFMAIGFIFLLTLILKGRKPRLYKEEKFIFDFLTPKKAHKNRYLFLTISFTILLVLGAFFGLMQRFPPASAFVIGFLAMLWCYILVYYVLYPYSRKNFKFHLNNTLFLIAVVFLNILLWNEGSQEGWKFGSAILMQFVCLVLILVSQVVLGYDRPQAISESHAVTYSQGKGGLKTYAGDIRSWFEKFPLSLSNRYSLFLFSWLLAAALLPAIIFYVKAEKINEQIWVKTDQIYMSHTYLGKERKLKEIISPIASGYLEQKYREVRQKHLDNGSYIDKRYSLTKAPVVADNDRKSAGISPFRKLLWSARPIFNEKVRNYKGMVYQTASDSSWTSEEKQQQVKLSALNGNSGKDRIILDWTGIQSPPEERKNFHYYLLALRLIGILVLMGILYSLIRFYTNRFYGFRFGHLKPVSFDTDKEIDYVSEFGKMLRFRRSNSGLLLIGLPFSGKKRFSEKIIQACDLIVKDEEGQKANAEEIGQRTAYLSFLKLDDTKKEEDIEAILNSLALRPLFTKRKENWYPLHWKQAEYFIIENLEHGLRSFELNKMKLKVISYLVAHKKRLVVNSEVYPNQVLAIYKPLFERGTDRDENTLVGDYNSWRNIFGAFPQVLIGMTDRKKQVVEVLNEMTDQKQIVEDIADEVGYSQFLPKLAPVMIAKYKDSSYFDSQSMVLHVQKLSHGYYTDIWNALPSRERYMLYDLAKDGFMNIKNGNSLFSLMKKGLIVWRDRPRVFNQSFQNFIISFVSKKEALQLEVRNRKDSSWGTIKIVMYLTILTLIVFILLGEPGLLEDFEELLAAVGGLGVILPIISTILGRSSEK